MPSRILRDWTDSEAINSMSLQAECFFVRLIMKADDFGRFNASPKLLRSLLFPIKDGIRDADITRWLAECEKSGLLRVYTSSDAKPLLEIVKFGQRTRAEKSKFEAPPTIDSNSLTNDRSCPPNAESNFGVGIRSSETETDATAPPKFVRPTVEQVRDYCRERGNAVDPEAFVDFYASKGWKVGSEPMRDWKACVRTWEKRDGNGTRGTAVNQNHSRQRAANPGSSRGSEDEWASQFEAEQAARAAEASQELAGKRSAG